MEERWAPFACRSAQCADPTACDSCAGKPAKDAFNEWKERTRAVRPDTTWSPGMWRATVELES